jgi:haloacetate dehalogenase
MLWTDFRPELIETRETRVFVRRSGSGPPVVLLHGFPETHLMWRGVAPLLARDFTVVCGDLRGYGASGCPPSAPHHTPYSKRAMAQDVVEVMRHLGFPRFSIVGHDRGARVAYRLALDHPESVDRLAVLDIVPTADVWSRADDRFALGYWPWSLLAQHEPLPERLIAAAPNAIVDDAFANWGSSANAFDPEIRAAYVAALSDPDHAHAICEEYRAASALDRQHDEADRSAGRRIKAPVHVLWSNRGALHDWYAEDGGPLALWREWADTVDGQSVDAGHFFPEEIPDQTAAALASFLMVRKVA